MPIINTEDWNKWETRNTDPYGKTCVDVAREAMRMLDEHPEDKIDVHKLICDADKNIDAGGITGFMAGCVAQVIATCHSRGPEFKKAWNEFYGVKDEAKGVVNPAIVTIDLDKAG